MGDPLFPQSERSRAINPMLYTKLLQTCPGGVKIANEGQGCLTSTVRQADGRHFTSFHYSGEYYRVNCPFCRDQGHRLWVNHMFGQHDANGRPMYFLATCYNEQCLKDYGKRSQFVDMLFKFVNEHERDRAVFPLQETAWIDDPSGLLVAEPPGELIPMSQMARSMPTHHAVQYMCGERRYTCEVFDRYRISYCPRSEKYPTASDRVVFPIIMNGSMVGWQARYIGSTNWKYTPKYYGLPGMRKRLMLYNYDWAKQMPFVCVVEGPTDCNAVGDAGVALLGKSLSPYQTQLLLSTWDRKPIIFILDPDAKKEMEGIVNDLRQTGAIVCEITLPVDHDCGDYDSSSLWQIIYQQTAAVGIRLPTA